jgi:hypothetical protein
MHRERGRLFPDGELADLFEVRRRHSTRHRCTTRW